MFERNVVSKIAAILSFYLLSSAQQSFPQRVIQKFDPNIIVEFDWSNLCLKRCGESCATKTECTQFDADAVAKVIKNLHYIWKLAKYDTLSFIEMVKLQKQHSFYIEPKGMNF